MVYGYRLANSSRNCIALSLYSSLVALMNTPLGVLPQEVPLEFDDLMVPVVKRMRQDGFDEEAILADFVAAVDAIS